jgi:hypothetical protein
MWICFELFVVWKFYIETRNTPLEEIVKHFDGESAILGGDVATEKSRQLVAEIEMVTTEPVVATGVEKDGNVQHSERSAV